MDDQLDLAYLAGFVDGEGYIAIGVNRNPNGNRRWYLRFSVHQINPEPLRLLVERFGGSIQRTPRQGTQRTIHEWISTSTMAAAAIKALLPYLRVKAAEARVAIEFQSLMTAPGDRRRGLSPEQEAERERLYREMRRLKHIAYEDEELTPRRLPAAPKLPKMVRQKVAEPIRSTGYDRKKKPVENELAFAYTATGLAATAKHYGVSRQTILNWLDAYGVPRQGRTPESEKRRLERAAATWRKP